MLPVPEVFLLRASNPTAVLKLPDVVAFKEFIPIDELAIPEVIFPKLSEPTPIFCEFDNSITVAPDEKLESVDSTSEMFPTESFPLIDASFRIETVPEVCPSNRSPVEKSPVIKLFN